MPSILTLERVIPVEVIQYIEVPVERIVERVVEVLKEVPVDRVVERLVEIPVTHTGFCVVLTKTDRRRESTQNLRLKRVFSPPKWVMFECPFA